MRVRKEFVSVQPCMFPRQRKDISTTSVDRRARGNVIVDKMCISNVYTQVSMCPLSANWADELLHCSNEEKLNVPYKVLHAVQGHQSILILCLFRERDICFTATGGTFSPTGCWWNSAIKSVSGRLRDKTTLVNISPDLLVVENQQFWSAAYTYNESVLQLIGA